MEHKFKFDPNTMKREYIFVANRKEIEEKLREMGFDNVFLLKNEMPDETELAEIQDMGYRAVCFVTYFDVIDKTEQFKKTVNEHIRVTWPRYYSNYMEHQGCELIIHGKLIETDECGEIDLSKFDLSIDDFCELFDRFFEKMDLWQQTAGYISHTDYENRCGNCHKILGESDKYCMCCGTKRGEGKYLPYTNGVDYLYGCPSYIKWKCEKCNKEYLNWGVGETKSFCPCCGSKMNKKKEIIADFFDDHEDIERRMMEESDE